jgi:hypothetical protein
MRANVGRTPSSARVPLDPLFFQPNRNHAIPEEADGGVGRGPGGPPYTEAPYAG